jgi:hypothetical protein
LPEFILELDEDFEKEIAPEVKDRAWQFISFQRARACELAAEWAHRYGQPEMAPDLLAAQRTHERRYRRVDRLYHPITDFIGLRAGRAAMGLEFFTAMWLEIAVASWWINIGYSDIDTTDYQREHAAFCAKEIERLGSMAYSDIQLRLVEKSQLDLRWGCDLYQQIPKTEVKALHRLLYATA